MVEVTSPRRGAARAETEEEEMNPDPADRLPFQLCILALVILAAWAVFSKPSHVVIFNLPARPVPVIQIPP
jgi:hypothetical protein